MFARLSRAFEELGFVDTVLYATERILARTASARLFRYVFVAQPVPDGPLLPPRRGRSINVRAVDPRESALLALDLTRDVLDSRANQGAVCFAAYEDGAIIGCLWLTLGAYDEDEVRCRFTPMPDGTTCWDFGIYVLPEKRTGFAFAKLWDTANGFLREHGVAWSLSRISPFNSASMASHRRLGIVRLGGAVFVRVGGIQAMFSGLRPYLHLSAGPDRTPHIVLRAPSGSFPPG